MINEKSNESVLNLDSGAALQRAKDNGWLVVYPRENQLQIDIDDEAHYKQFQEKLELLKEYLDVSNVEEHFSMSGSPRRHITVTLTDKTVNESLRIALQACLGSDPKRELFGCIRIMNNDPHPTLFFEAGEVWRGK